MTFSLALNANRDLFIGNDGRLATVSGMDAVLQNCDTAMRAQLGEMIYSMNKGVPYRQLLWDNYDPISWGAAAQATILAVDGVSSIVSFIMNKSGNIFSYSAIIATKYGQGQIDGNL